MADNDRMLEYAEQVRNSFVEKWRRIEDVYRVSRQRVSNSSRVAGRGIETAPTARANSLLTQLLAFATVPSAEVLPKDNSEKEDERTSQIERWFVGYPRAIPFVQMHPFKAFLQNYAESGHGALLLGFDEGKALAGKFPLIVRAPAPDALAFTFSDEEVVCAVLQEQKQAAGLYHDLMGRWESAVKPEWSVPEVLRKANEQNPTAVLEVMTLHTNEAEYYWVERERVWERPQLCGGVPLDLAFCNPLASDLPEEWGQGLLWQVLGMLVNEQKLLDKAYTGFEFFTFPLERVYFQDGSISTRQAKPGTDYTNAVKVEQVTVVPNYNMLELLADKSDNAISKATLQEVTFGEGKDTTSGYQVNLLQEGPRRRIQDLLGDEISGAAAGLTKHYRRVLKYVEHFATEDMAKEMGAKGQTGIETYLNSFATRAAPAKSPEKKSRAKIVLSAEDVRGYEDVVVTLLPELAEDKNAKFQRAQLAQQVGMSREGVFRTIIKVEEPDQELAWQREDMMMQDEMWQEFMLKKAIKDKLNKDKDLAKEFDEFVAAKQAEQAQQPQAPSAPEAQQISASAPVPPEQQGMGTGAAPQDMQGMSPENMPPAMMGQGQPDPQLAALQATFGGG